MSTRPPDSTPVTTGASGARPLTVLALMFNRRIAGSALRVAIVVGAVLNMINNGQQLWEHHPVGFWQVAMNFVVPFCVSSYSAARNEAQRGKGG